MHSFLNMRLSVDSTWRPVPSRQTVIFYIVCITAPQHNLGLAVDSRRIKQETRASSVSIFLSEAVVGSEILMESALIIQVMLASISI